MKYLIVGLGNVGSEYAGTRHNAGFEVLDALAGASNTSFTVDRYGSVAEFRHKGRTITLLKPSTFMNNSGKAVRYWIDFLKVDIENVLIVLDDVAIPFGDLRLRTKGSAGGHNGLKDITNILQTDNYARLRFGIGSDYPKGAQVDFVLSPWADAERSALPEAVKKFCDAILTFTTGGVNEAMNKFNTKSKPNAAAK